MKVTTISPPRKARASQGTANSVIVSTLKVHGGLGYDTVVCVTSDLPGLDALYAYFTPAEWEKFIYAVKRGEFDLDESNQLPALVTS